MRLYIAQYEVSERVCEVVTQLLGTHIFVGYRNLKLKLKKTLINCEAKIYGTSQW